MVSFNRYEVAVEMIPEGSKTLLDVGCRDAVLKSFLPGNIKYTGVDLIDGPQVDYICNLEDGLPFDDNCFDVVVALDVLEHTEDIWASFSELVRVSKTSVVVILPNIYHWSLRLRYLCGDEFGKYVLSPSPIQDRHRWLTSYNAAFNFANQMARSHGLSVSARDIYGAKRYAPIDIILSKLSKNLAIWSVAFIFTKG